MAEGVRYLRRGLGRPPVVRVELAELAKYLPLQHEVCCFGKGDGAVRCKPISLEAHQSCVPHVNEARLAILRRVGHFVEELCKPRCLLLHRHVSGSDLEVLELRLERLQDQVRPLGEALHATARRAAPVCVPRFARSEWLQPVREVQGAGALVPPALVRCVLLPRWNLQGLPCVRRALADLLLPLIAAVHPIKDGGHARMVHEDRVSHRCTDALQGKRCLLFSWPDNLIYSSNRDSGMVASLVELPAPFSRIWQHNADLDLAILAHEAQKAKHR
mmetsp:Transcript_2147/g.6003  ORF Transcript_2147/g.6003 Transcript_2147/m.6003 type:complete len:274 (-) Transcript_2147:222-1043(-)